MRTVVPRAPVPRPCDRHRSRAFCRGRARAHAHLALSVAVEVSRKSCRPRHSGAQGHGWVPVQSRAQACPAQPDLREVCAILPRVEDEP
eukprot:14226473-Alexandrium_andersonii.AAC.1